VNFNPFGRTPTKWNLLKFDRTVSINVRDQIMRLWLSRTGAPARSQVSFWSIDKSNHDSSRITTECHTPASWNYRNCSSSRDIWAQVRFCASGRTFDIHRRWRMPRPSDVINCPCAEFRGISVNRIKSRTEANGYSVIAGKMASSILSRSLVGEDVGDSSILETKAIS
jgi:hypothetical protein